MKLLLESWRQFLSENQRPLFKKAKIKRYTDLALFAETEGDKMIGSAVVIFDQEGRVLILKRAAISHWMPLKWGLPGGLINKGEAAIRAAVREVKEETTLDIPEPMEFYLSDNGEVVYFTTQEYSGEVTIDFEHEDFAWVYPEDLTNYDRVPHLVNVVERAKEALNYA
tara:strand:+ start:261 stop:764 length:504 start_codon:yes stop_codon:yes gene_type:complete